MKKLNTQGIAHIIAPMLTMLAIAGVGTYVFATSHADSLNSTAVHVTNANNNQTVALVTGQVLDVKLSSHYKFNQSSDKKVLAQIGHTQYKENFSKARYRVIAAGTTTLSATGPRRSCPAATPGQATCHMISAAQAFKVTITATVQPVKPALTGVLNGRVYLRTAGGPAVTCAVGRTCPPGTKLQPYKATIKINSITPKTLDTYEKTVISNVNGEFSVKLLPGTYRLLPQPERIATAPAQTVTIAKGATSSVEVIYTLPIPTPSPAPQPTPAPTPAPTPTPGTNPNIKHPTADNCNRQQFTVYASLPNGTPAYGLNGGTQAGKVLYTVPYGTAITNVYCDSDANGKVYRIDNGSAASYSSYNFTDVSLTKP